MTLASCLILPASAGTAAAQCVKHMALLDYNDALCGQILGHISCITFGAQIRSRGVVLLCEMQPDTPLWRAACCTVVCTFCACVRCNKRFASTPPIRESNGSDGADKVHVAPKPSDAAEHTELICSRPRPRLSKCFRRPMVGPVGSCLYAQA